MVSTLSLLAACFKRSLAWSSSSPMTLASMSRCQTRLHGHLVDGPHE